MLPFPGTMNGAKKDAPTSYPPLGLGGSLLDQLASWRLASPQSNGKTGSRLGLYFPTPRFAVIAFSWCFLFFFNQVMKDKDIHCEQILDKKAQCSLICSGSVAAHKQSLGEEVRADTDFILLLAQCCTSLRQVSTLLSQKLEAEKIYQIILFS